MRLVEQDARWLGSGDDLRIEGLHLEEGFRLPVADAFQMGLNVKLRGQHRVRFNHADGLIEGQIGDLLRRRDEQKLGARALVDQKRREHDRGAASRLRVLLRHEDERLADLPLAAHHRSEQRLDDVPLPVARSLAHPRLAGNIRQTQRVEYARRPARGVLIER